MMNRISDILKIAIAVKSILYPTRLDKALKKIYENPNGTIEVEELSVISDDYYDKGPIEKGFYKIREEFKEGFLFEVLKVGLSVDEDMRIGKNSIDLVELTFDSGIEMSIPIEHFNEFFEVVNIPPLEK